MESALQLPLTNSAHRLAVRVTPAAERAVRRGHPWVFDDAVLSVRPDGRSGDLAVIFDQRRRFLALGLYDPDSPLRIRVLHHGAPRPIDADWWDARLAQALALRAAPAIPADTDAYRCLHGENDGFPGMVFDRYGAYGVLKLYTAAWLPHLPTVLPLLLRRVTLQGVVLRVARRIADRLPAGWDDGATLWGTPPPEEVRFRENGLWFAADLRRGHKTGHFLDQRENRARVRELAAGCEVLDLFACTGGFALYAAAGGARAVLSVDLSGPALETAARNFALNRDLPAVRVCRYETLVADAWDPTWQHGRAFDLVVVDPPALAHRQADVPAALQAYRRLAEAALRMTRPGGRLVMASCSGRVSAEAFFAVIEQAAQGLGRRLRDRQHTAHAADHPIGFPEGAYLKCLSARVE